MTEEASDELLVILRQKRDGNPWLATTMKELVAAGHRDAFKLHCMSAARKVLDGRFPDGAVDTAMEKLWREMGGST